MKLTGLRWSPDGEAYVPALIFDCPRCGAHAIRVPVRRDSDPPLSNGWNVVSREPGRETLDPSVDTFCGGERLHGYVRDGEWVTV